MAKYPAYQCLQTEQMETYCSGYKVRNHTEGKWWVSATMHHFGIRGDGLRRVFLSHNQPTGAIIYTPPREQEESIEEAAT